MILNVILNTVSFSALLLSLSGFEAIVHLTQEKTMDVSVGQNVNILCKKDQKGWVISWYQQKQGDAPKFLLADSSRASGLPSRFTYTDNGMDEYLNINGMQAEDEAVYYCGCILCEDHHSCHGSIGVGTELRLTRPASPPSLLVLAPSQAPPSGGVASVLCLARGFYPDDATLSWSEDGTTMAGPEVQTVASRRQTDGTFSRSSFLNLSAERWNSGHSYTCTVRHSALTSPVSSTTGMEKCS
ncbi:immunoglobulin kappa light chain-like [Brachyhypopomus gauderio]|uniref:immunoglobulin kappa light chain-like n=1 Tax=Brachyhypopomus gauderio TaxID=698409 RepID=UPI0040412DDA